MIAQEEKASLLKRVVTSNLFVKDGKAHIELAEPFYESRQLAVLEGKWR